MAIRIHLHATHRPHAAGLETVEVQGTTVGECLANLVREHPAMDGALFASPGKLRNNVEIYLNLESTYPDELLRETRDGDEIHVTLILTGG
jgi:hypothetical protein